jgi:hypothetical protein
MLREREVFWPVQAIGPQCVVYALFPSGIKFFMEISYELSEYLGILVNGI